jgi:hypothetical protein
MMFREIIDFLSENHMQKGYVSRQKGELVNVESDVTTTATCLKAPI